MTKFKKVHWQPLTDHQLQIMRCFSFGSLNFTIFADFVVKQPLCYQVSLHFLVIESDQVPKFQFEMVPRHGLVLPGNRKSGLLYRDIQFMAENNEELIFVRQTNMD